MSNPHPIDVKAGMEDIIRRAENALGEIAGSLDRQRPLRDWSPQAKAGLIAAMEIGQNTRIPDVELAQALRAHLFGHNARPDTLRTMTGHLAENKLESELFGTVVRRDLRYLTQSGCGTYLLREEQASD